MRAEPQLRIPNAARWRIASLASLCRVISRGTAPSYVEQSDVLAIGQRCVTANGFDGSCARPHAATSMKGVLEVAQGDVLLNSTGTGTIGRSCVFGVPGRFIADGHVTVLRPDPRGCDGRWLDAVLKSPWGQTLLETQCYAGSTNQVELSRTQLARARLPVPSHEEQLRIAAALATLDRAIEASERLIAKLGHLQGGVLDDLLTKGVDDNGQVRDSARHPEQFKTSDLGLVPNGWSASSLGPVLLDARYGTSAPSTTGPGGTPVLRIPNIADGALSLRDLQYQQPSNRELERFSTRPGDLLLIRSNGNPSLLARCAEVPPSAPTFLFASYLIRLRLDVARAAPSFISACLRAARARRYVLSRTATSAGNYNINIAQLRAMPLVLPPIAEQHLITQALARWEHALRTEREGVAKLRSVRRGLHEDLLTGRVRTTTLPAP